MALPTKLTDTTQSHLDALVADGTQENQHRDYKRELPTNWDNETKKRFIADVVAMANASGGDVIYGVEEDDDAGANAVVPQAFASGVDAEVRRLQDFILAQVEPRLQGVQIQPVPVTVAAVSGYVLIIRIPQSWSGPHRSNLSLHFSIRDGLRNRTLDVREIGAAFRGTANRTEWYRNLRVERLAKIMTGQTPVTLGDPPKLVVHAISSQAALELAHINPLPYATNARQLPCIGWGYTSGVRLNLDGAFGETPHSQKNDGGYTQHFRQGYFESVVDVKQSGHAKGPHLNGITYEKNVIAFLEKIRAEFAAAGVSQEMVVFLSLLRATAVELSGPGDMGPSSYELQRFDRQDVLVPDVVIEADVSVGRGLRPAFDLMCQAAGYLGSQNYDENGEWVGRQ